MRRTDRLDAAVTPEVDAVDHQRHPVEVRHIGGHQLGQGGLGGGHEPSRDRGARRPPTGRLDRRADRLQAGAVAAGGDLGKHLVHGEAAEPKRRGLHKPIEQIGDLLAG
jgi:hypothetical protein